MVWAREESKSDPYAHAAAWGGNNVKMAGGRDVLCKVTTTSSQWVRCQTSDPAACHGAAESGAWLSPDDFGVAFPNTCMTASSTMIVQRMS